MPNDHNHSQGRRPHYQRGRRGGGDRRPPDRRPTSGAQEHAGRDQVDVEQIMRDIRARIAKRHGIDLTPQQVRELAARRLEAILEPRHVAPSLMEQMRRAAGEPIEVPTPRTDARAELDEAAIYASHRGLVRKLRQWLNPVLKLLFNPTPLVETLRDLTRRSNAAAARETELYARQAEWNALHFEILQRLVTEVARATIENQALAARAESLAAKIDFTERRMRILEAVGTAPQGRPAPRQPDQPAGDPGRPVAGAATETSSPSTSVDGSSDGPRRRRRRRRGRRGGGGFPGDAPGAQAQQSAPPASELDPDTDDGADLDADGDETDSSEPGEATAPVADLASSSDLTSSGGSDAAFAPAPSPSADERETPADPPPTRPRDESGTSEP